MFLISQNFMISRLASLHRGVLRALHMYIRSLADADVCDGVLMGCRDFVAIIRRLTLCSAQLDVTSNANPRPDDVLSILDDILVQSSLYSYFYRVLMILVKVVCLEISRNLF